MARFEKVPAYLLPGTTPQDIAKAREALNYMRMHNPAFDLQMPFRRAAFHARIQSAMHITVDMYVEFEAAIPPNYAASWDLQQAQVAQAAQIQAEGKAKYEAQQAEIRAREAAAPRQPQSLKEAVAKWPHGGLEYNAWVAANQHILANGDFLD